MADPELSAIEKDEVSMRKGSCKSMLADLRTQWSHPVRKFGA